MGWLVFISAIGVLGVLSVQRASLKVWTIGTGVWALLVTLVTGLGLGMIVPLDLKNWVRPPPRKWPRTSLTA